MRLNKEATALDEGALLADALLDNHWPDEHDGDSDEALHLAATTGVVIDSPTSEEVTACRHPMFMVQRWGGPRIFRRALAEGRLEFTVVNEKPFTPVWLLIEQAANDKCAYDALMLIIESRVGKSLPENLISWYRSAPKRPKKGRYKDLMRNQAIIAVVFELTKMLDVDATRNDVSKERSACDFVALALLRRGYKTCKYHRIKEIWNTADEWKVSLP